jgi:hypothetical protein
MIGGLSGAGCDQLTSQGLILGGNDFDVVLEGAGIMIHYPMEPCMSHKKSNQPVHCLCEEDDFISFRFFQINNKNNLRSKALTRISSRSSYTHPAMEHKACSQREIALSNYG